MFLRYSKKISLKTSGHYCFLFFGGFFVFFWGGGGGEGDKGDRGGV